MDKAKVLEKVRKLLEKTEVNGCTAGEAASAAALARKLLAQHGLDLSDLSEEEKSILEFDLEMETKTVSESQGYISKVIADHFGCEVIIRGNKSKSCLVFIGEKVKVDICKETFVFVYKTYKRCWKIYHQSLGLSTSEKSLKRKTYLMGFLDGLTNELIKSENETALVVSKSADLKDYMGTLNLSQKKFTSKSSFQKEDYDKGYSDGAFSQRNKNKSIDNE